MQSERERKNNKNKMNEQHVRLPRAARIVHPHRMRVCGLMYEKEKKKNRIKAILSIYLLNEYSNELG
jgi:hypothetical protein